MAPSEHNESLINLSYNLIFGLSYWITSENKFISLNSLHYWGDWILKPAYAIVWILVQKSFSVVKPLLAPQSDPFGHTWPLAAIEQGWSR